MSKKRLSKNPVGIDEALRIIHDPVITHTGKVLAALAIADVCEDESKVTLQDLLRCLDYGGTIAEAGARGLYVRTGRDGLGWGNAGSNGLPYIITRADWESYLRAKSLIE